MKQRLIGSGIRFAIAIVLILAFGGLFNVYTSEVLAQERQNDVLIKAIPFVAVFVAILLVYIYLIVALATVVNKRVPQRTYRPIAAIIIAGILLGVVALFQGWKLFAYEYGFLLLLFSTLGFIAWSHIVPLSARASLLPLPRRAHVVGLVVGAVIWGALVSGLTLDSRPAEPYGINRQIWERMMDDQERQDTVDQAENEFRTARIPVFALISLLPAGLVYFAARELAAPGGIVDEADEPVTTGPAEVSDLTAP